MAEQDDNADPSAAIALEDTLKEFDNPAEGGLEDILKEIEVSVSDSEGEPPEGGDPDNPTPDPEDKEPTPDPEDPDKGKSVVDEEFEDEEPEDEPAEEEDPDEAPKNLSKKGQADWTALKTAKEEFKTKFQEAEQVRTQLSEEVTELKKQVAELPELREKVKFIEEAEKELAISRVEGTAEFKKTITEPLKAIESQAVAIAKGNEDVSEDKLFTALEEPDPAKRRALLKEVTEDMDNVDRDEVFQMARDTQSLLAKQQEIRSKAREAAKEAQTNAEAEEQARTKKARDEYVRASEHVMSELRKRLPFEALSEDETEDGVYEALTNKLKEVDFDGATADRKAYTVAAGVLLPRLTKQLKAAQDKITKLETRVTRKNKGKPKLGDDAPTPSKDNYEGDVENAVADFLNMEKSRSITDILSEQ